MALDVGDDPTQRFGARAKAYARARPGYPESVVAALAQALELAAGATVVDLGCGTGLSSEAFLRAGFCVIGVEPNAAMRAQAARLAQTYPGYVLLAARAEATSVPPASADLVIAAQAFHWFDVAAARAEALRILRPPPRAALLWNDRRTDGSEFARGYEQLLQRFGTDYSEVQRRHAQTQRIAQFFGDAPWRTLRIAHTTALDFDTLADRLNSASYVPPAGDARHGPMMQRLRELFGATARNGLVQMEFETRVHYGQMRPQSADPAAQRPSK